MPPITPKGSKTVENAKKPASEKKQVSKVAKNTDTKTKKTTSKKTTTKVAKKDVKNSKKDVEKNIKITKTLKKETKPSTKVAKAIKTVSEKKTVVKKPPVKKEVKTKVLSSTSAKKTEKKAVTKTTKPVVKKEKVVKKVENKIKQPAKKVVSKKTAKTSDVKTTTKPKAKTVKKSLSKKDKRMISSEYYELPYAYNQTIVRILAQTPNSLFIYWDVSSDHIAHLKKTYGDDFYNKTRPVLIIHNQTKGYSYEITVNDFANSWYLHVGDTKCKYHIELGRKFNEKVYEHNIDDYVYITSSNVIESPNDHILYEKDQKMLYYYNLKTKQTTTLPMLSFITNMGRIYGTYKEMQVESIHNNPSSGGLSSSGSLTSSGGIYE